jgi:hypothetical protein
MTEGCGVQRPGRSAELEARVAELEAAIEGLTAKIEDLEDEIAQQMIDAAERSSLNVLTYRRLLVEIDALFGIRNFPLALRLSLDDFGELLYDRD